MTRADMVDMEQLVREWHKERLDFIHDIASKYPMTNQEICKLCEYMEVQRWQLDQNILEEV